MVLGACVLCGEGAGDRTTSCCSSPFHSKCLALHRAYSKARSGPNAPLLCPVCRATPFSPIMSRANSATLTDDEEVGFELVLGNQYYGQESMFRVSDDEEEVVTVEPVVEPPSLFPEQYTPSGSVSSFQSSSVVDAMERQYVNFQTREDRWQKKIEESQERCLAMVEEQARLRQTLFERDTELTAIKTEIIGLKESYHSEVTRLVTEADDKELALNGLKTSYTGMEGENTRLQAIVGELESRITSGEQLNCEWATAYEELESQYNASVQESTELITTSDDLNQEKKLLEMHVVSLEQQLSSLELDNTGFNDKIQSLTHELDQSSKDLRERIEELEAENLKLTEDVKSSMETSAATDALQETLATCKTELQHLEAANLIVSTEKTEYREWAENLQLELDEMSTALGEEQFKNSEYEISVLNMEKDHAELQLKVSNASNQIAELEKQLEMSQDEQFRNSTRAADLERTIISLKEEIEFTAHSRKAVARMEGELSSITSEMLEKESQVSVANDRISDLETQLIQFQEQQAHLIELQSQFDKNESKLDASKNHICKLNEQLEVSENEIRSLISSLGVEQEQVAALTHSHELTKSSLTIDLEKALSRVASLSIELDEISSVLSTDVYDLYQSNLGVVDAMSKDCKNHMDMIESMSSRIYLLEDRLSTANAYTQQWSECVAVVDQSKVSIEHLRSLVAGESSIIFNNQVAEIDTLKRSVQMHQETIETMQQRITDLNGELEGSYERSSVLVENNQALTLEYANVISEMDDLKQSSEKHQEVVEEMQQRHLTLSNQLEESQELNNSIVEKSNALKLEFEESKSTLQETIDDTRASLNALEGNYAEALSKIDCSGAETSEKVSEMESHQSSLYAEISDLQHYIAELQTSQMKTPGLIVQDVASTVGELGETRLLCERMEQVMEYWRLRFIDSVDYSKLLWDAYQLKQVSVSSPKLIPGGLSLNERRFQELEELLKQKEDFVDELVAKLEGYSTASETDFEFGDDEVEKQEYIFDPVEATWVLKSSAARRGRTPSVVALIADLRSERDTALRELGNNCKVVRATDIAKEQHQVKELQDRLEGLVARTVDVKAGIRDKFDDVKEIPSHLWTCSISCNRFLLVSIVVILSVSLLCYTLEPTLSLPAPLQYLHDEL